MPTVGNANHAGLEREDSVKFHGLDGQEYIALFNDVSDECYCGQASILEVCDFCSSKQPKFWWDVATIDADGCLVKFVCSIR